MNRKLAISVTPIINNITPDSVAGIGTKKNRGGKVSDVKKNTIAAIKLPKIVTMSIFDLYIGSLKGLLRKQMKAFTMKGRLMRRNMIV